MSVTAPPEETAWLLHHVVGFDAIGQDDTAAILEEAARFAEGVLAPLERIGDTVGSKLVDGVVVTPPGFKEAFQAYAEGGWIGTAAPEAHGGQGLPDVIALAAFEPVSSANMGSACARCSPRTPSSCWKPTAPRTRRPGCCRRWWPGAGPARCA